MAAFTIRPAEWDDLAGIAEIHVGGWRWAYRGLVPDELLESLSVEDREAMWRRAIDRPRHALTVAEQDGGVIGFVSVGPTLDADAAEATGEVYAIYLRPESVGRGMGRALLERAVGDLTALGFVRGSLWVLENNARTRRFYEVAGWCPDGTEKTEDWNGFPLREVRYVIDLGGG